MEKAAAGSKITQILEINELQKFSPCTLNQVMAKESSEMHKTYNLVFVTIHNFTEYMAKVECLPITFDRVDEIKRSFMNPTLCHQHPTL